MQAFIVFVSQELKNSRTQKPKNLKTQELKNLETQKPTNLKT